MNTATLHPPAAQSGPDADLEAHALPCPARQGGWPPEELLFL